MENNKINAAKVLIHICTIAGIIATLLFIIYGFKNRIFTSSDTLSQYVLKAGVMAPLVFILIQIVQVVIPILPGSIGCATGVILFGPVMGFVYNYVGICIGSVLVFMLAKRYGLPLVQSMVSEKVYAKYSGWLTQEKRFDKLFATAIFLPVAPDDMLCYLAGLTPMSLRKFTLIILLCKPLSTMLYSIGLAKALSLMEAFFHTSSAKLF